MLNKKNKASVLVVALIILGVILVTTLSISLVAVRERKASIGASSTDVAYQNAETGVEAVMNAIINVGYANIGALSQSGKLNGTGYATVLEKSDGSLIDLSVGNTEPISDIATIKSVGTDTGGQNQRAIEAAVASGGNLVKACSVFSTTALSTFYDSMPVNNDWQIANCKSWAADICSSSTLNISNCKYQVGCYTSVSGSNDPILWGSAAGTGSTANAPSSPPSNCTWN